MFPGWSSGRSHRLYGGAGEGACEVHNPSYDFNDGALGLGASVFAKIVETRLPINPYRGAP